MILTTETVKDVSLPHVDPNFTSTSMVVDVTTSANPDRSTTYCMPCDTDIAYPQNKVITTDRANLLREIESIKSMSEQALSQIDHHRAVIGKASALIAELDPVQREKQAVEARFNSMESRFSSIEDSMTKMMNILTQFTKTQS